MSSDLRLARSWRLRRSGDPSHDVQLFVALLREAGVAVPVSGTLTAVRALAAISLESRTDVRAALRACLVGSAEEGAVFDRLFAAFWSADVPELAEVADGDAAEREPGADDSGADDAAARQFAGRQHGSGDEQARRARYSRSGRRDTRPAALPAGGAEIEVLARRLVRALAHVRGRRLRAAEAGDVIDIRESLRRNLGFGEELLELRRMRERVDRARIVVLCDVSSSMEPFTPLFLTLMHAVTRVAASVEAAIFNVELCSVTDVFRRRSLGEALVWLADRSVALAGGTRTGHCLHAFNQQIAARGLAGPRTTALMLSDGWDVGEPELLAEQARRLRRQVGRFIWLDPHAAASGYRPQVRGLKIALPYVDDYLDFSTAAALRYLVGQVEASVA